MKKLQWKIAAVFVLLATIVVIIAGVVAGSQFERYYKEEQKEILAQRLDLIWLLLEESAPANQADLYHLIKRTAGLIQTRITLIDSSGGVIGDSEVSLDATTAMESHIDRKEIAMAGREHIGFDVRKSATLGDDFMYVAKHFTPLPESRALTEVRFVRVSVRLKEISEYVATIRSIIFLSGATLVLLVFLLSLAVGRQISKPIVDIVRSVEEIRSGNLDVSVQAKGSEEIERVARAIEGMRETLKTDLAQLRKLERVRTEFLGNVSHELRTPLFSLQGYLETLIDGALDDPKVNRAFLEKAAHHASRLNTLLDDLMTISQIESGEMKMSFRYFPLADLLTDVYQEFQPFVDRYRVRLHPVQTIGVEQPVLGDRERLRVVFENLLENALKYNQPDGEISVILHYQSSVVAIELRDTGTGIAAEHLPRIFERFYRADKDRSREVGGTGLGLAICKHIIEAHSSNIEVESRVGEGSAFRFTLRT